MGFCSKISKVLEAQFNRYILSKIELRSKIERSLIDLLDWCDSLTYDAFLQKNTMADIGKEMDKVYSDFVLRHGELTVNEKEFIDTQIGKLDKTVRKRGENHISNLSKPTKLSFLRCEGGDGYTLRHLPLNWKKVPYEFSSASPITELQDRVFGRHQ